MPEDDNYPICPKCGGRLKKKAKKHIKIPIEDEDDNGTDESDAKD